MYSPPVCLRLDSISASPHSSPCPTAPKSDHPGIGDSHCEPGTAPQKETPAGARPAQMADLWGESSNQHPLVLEPSASLYHFHLPPERNTSNTTFIGASSSLYKGLAPKANRGDYKLLQCPRHRTFGGRSKGGGLGVGVGRSRGWGLGKFL